MNALLISRSRLLQVTKVSVKGHASLQPFSTEVEKQNRRVLPTDPGMKPFSAIPGPPTLPVIGTLWDYYRGKYNLQKPYETYSTFLKNYGPLVKEKVFLGHTLVHVFRPRDLEVVYDSERHIRPSLPIRHSHGALKMYRKSKKDLYGHIGVAPSNGEEWKNYRMLFQRSTGVLDRPTVRDAFDEIAYDLVKYIKSNLDHNGEIPVFPALYYYTLESIGMFVLGTRIGCFDQNRGDEVTRLIQAVHDSHYAIHKTEYKPYILARKERKTLEISQDYIAHFVLKHMDDIIDRESEKEIDQFNEMWKSDGLVIDKEISNSATLSESFLYLKLKQGLTKRMILPMAVDFFQGGIHSTAHSLAFALYHLAMNPDIQEIFRDELVKCFPNKTDRSDVLKARYARRIMVESLRLNPPTIGTGRVLPQDVVLSGYHVPKGTKVILHHEIASKHEYNYPEPLRFIPGREMKTRFASNPFIDTSGRVCMGSEIAGSEIRVALMKIFRHFEVSYHYKKVGVVNYLVNEPDAPIILRLKEIPDNVAKKDDGTTEGK